MVASAYFYRHITADRSYFPWRNPGGAIYLHIVLISEYFLNQTLVLARRIL